MNEVYTGRKLLNLQIFMFRESLHNSTDFGFDTEKGNLISLNTFF